MHMVHARVAVFGAAGYTGLELVKLLALHPNIELVAASSDSHAGTSVTALTGATTTLAFVTAAQALETEADVALLAVPHAAAPDLAAKLRRKGTRVIDLSNAHRASADAAYGLTSWFAADAVASPLIANPGCYATAIITAVAPLARAGWIERDVVVAAGSGVTGAGKSATEAMSMSEMHGNVRAYKVLEHQHVPEIEMALGRIGGGGRTQTRVVLTTHLLPIARGIFATINVRLTSERSSAQLTAHMRETYRDDPTVCVMPTPEDVSVRKVVGTNQTLVGVASAGDLCVITAAIDNLLKGAAGQAVENMNLVLGVPRTTGLLHLSRHG